MSPWARMDDGMGDHRKTRRLLRAGGLDSFGLHSLAILHCAKYLTDGFVEQEFVDETLDDARVRGKSRTAVIGRLEDHGQWVPCDGGWMIHDYLDHNPSKVDVEARRAADAERKARGRDSESRRSPQGVRPDTARTDIGVLGESGRPVPALPDPTQLPPSPPRGNRTRDRERYEQALQTFVDEHFPDVPAGLVNHWASQLRGAGHEPTVELIRLNLEQHNGGVAA